MALRRPPTSCSTICRVVIDLLAEDFFGHTTVVAENPEIRVSITAGLLVPFISVYAVLGEDDAVEIIYLELG